MTSTTSLRSQSTGAVDTFSLSGMRLTAQYTGPRIEVRRSDDGAVLSRKIIVGQ